jgi:hypothetical protein
MNFVCIDDYYRIITLFYIILYQNETDYVVQISKLLRFVIVFLMLDLDCC